MVNQIQAIFKGHIKLTTVTARFGPATFTASPCISGKYFAGRRLNLRPIAPFHNAAPNANSIGRHIRDMQARDVEATAKTQYESRQFLALLVNEMPVCALYLKQGVIQSLQSKVLD